MGPEVGGIAHLQSQGEGEAANPQCPRDSNPGPLDPKSSIQPLSHRPRQGECQGDVGHFFGCTMISDFFQRQVCSMLCFSMLRMITESIL